MHHEKTPSRLQRTSCGTAVGDVTAVVVPRDRAAIRDLTPATTDEASGASEDAPARERRRTAPFGLARTARLARELGQAVMRPLRVAAAIGVVAACAQTAETPTASMTMAPAAAHGAEHDSDAPLTPEQLKGIAAVRRSTQRFHDLDSAIAAGYSLQYPAGCAQSELGSQGYHYLDTLRADAVVELLRPELVMYEPQPDGSKQLIGVDYVVPFSKWTSSQPPMLLGVPFKRNEPLGVWALHIWAWRPNPRGMFAMWNPNASCANAR